MGKSKSEVYANNLHNFDERKDNILSASTKKVSLWPFTESKPNLIETFIGKYTASVKAFFNIFTSGIETFVIPWDQLLYSCVVEVCCLGLEPLCDTHLRLSVSLKTLTG